MNTLQSLCMASLLIGVQGGQAGGTRDTETDAAVKQHLDAVPAIDTHDHLWPFDILPGRSQTERGYGVTLAGLWQNSYYAWYNPVTPRRSGQTFDHWWGEFENNVSVSTDARVRERSQGNRRLRVRSPAEPVDAGGDQGV